nr:MAG TPA: hypothetical protein [Caudoviricetes sp.]
MIRIECQLTTFSLLFNLHFNVYHYLYTLPIPYHPLPSYLITPISYSDLYL